MCVSEKLLYEEKYDEAIEILNSCYKTHKEKGYSVAIPSIGLANAYAFMGNTELQKKYLAISAIADIQAATKEYISLWKLANLLFQEGDIKRAYTYIECSMQDATFCNARYRTQEISELLPVISWTYENKLGRKEVLNVLHELNRKENVTIILITHYMEEVIDADYVYVMDGGKLVMDGTPRQIFTQVEMLKSMRLDVPQVTELAYELKKAGLPIKDGIIRNEELVEELKRLDK
mgnify:CR=1 FL=1